MKQMMVVLASVCSGILFAENLPLNPSAGGIPKGWRKYENAKVKGVTPTGSLKVERDILHIVDTSNVCELGVSRTLRELPAGKYVYTAEISGQPFGAQMVVIGGVQRVVKEFNRHTDSVGWVKYELPFELKSAKKVNVYIYGTYAGMPDFKVRNVQINPVK